MEEIRNKELFGKIAQGDQEAFADLYNENSKDIFAFALSILNNYHDAEDVMQEVFVKIRIHAEECKNFSNVNGWMIRVAKNQAIDWIRKKKEDVVKNPCQASLLGSIQPQEESVTENYPSVFISEICDELRDEERQVVVLHLISDLTHKTIAEILRLPLTTVKWRYRRAIQKLEKIAKKKGWEL